MAKTENPGKEPFALETADLIEQLKQAFRGDDASSVRELLTRHPALKAQINEPIGPFDTPAIVNARSREMVDVLLDAGADINAESRWWAGGFRLLDGASSEVAAYAIERGAVVYAHAAARLGMLEQLRALVSAKPELVHARGGDGQSPLHFACNIEIARYLLDHGAEIDARDVDHESTPAQYMVKDRQDVVRYLISRGCKTDILMAAAIGDLELVRRHLDADPDSIRMRVSDEFFPMVNAKAGGTIYQWTLGFYVSSHQVARNFGHLDVLQLLLKRSPEPVKLVAACWLRDEPTLRAILSADPEIAAKLSEPDRRQVAFAARNDETEVVRLMVEAGLPVNARGQHGATPLHWAGFHGNLEMISELLRFRPELEAIDADFRMTPLGWAIYGSENGWNRESGDYAGTVKALVEAGAEIPEKAEGTMAVQAVLRSLAPRKETS
jgi:ankyrin repeat protein